MLDILTIVHSFADVQTASRIRRTCRRLAAIIPQPKLYIKPSYGIEYEYRVGSKLHRLDGPARAHLSGHMCWYREGVAHREYHPYSAGELYRTYMAENVQHRETGPSDIYEDRTEWCLRGRLHRKMGPAHSWGGGIWVTLGKMHRLDGPAYDDLYIIRGIEHSIFSITDQTWKVNGVIIRRRFSTRCIIFSYIFRV